MAFFSSVKFETSVGRTIEHKDHCHPKLFMYRFLNSTNDEFERRLV